MQFAIPEPLEGQQICWAFLRGWGGGNRPQVREQMSGLEISKYGKSILGCGMWPGLDCGIRGSEPIMSNFRGPFFHFFWVKKKSLNFFENTTASALNSCIIIL